MLKLQYSLKSEITQRLYAKPFRGEGFNKLKEDHCQPSDHRKGELTLNFPIPKGLEEIIRPGLRKEASL
jgi:hypothetical protein